MRSANLTASETANVTWRYFAPLVIDVDVYPYGGCTIVDDCQALAAKCNASIASKAVRHNC